MYLCVGLSLQLNNVCDIFQKQTCTVFANLIEPFIMIVKKALKFLFSTSLSALYAGFRIEIKKASFLYPCLN